MITRTRSGPTDVVVLDRPAKRNALTLPLWRDLGRAVVELGRLRSAAPILVRGAGGYFCAGADLDSLASARTSESAAREFGETLVATLFAVHGSPRPVVAVVETGAAGGGVELMLACRARIAVGPVQLIFPFGDRGVVPDSFTAWRLERIVGPELARSLVTGTHRMSGEEAVACGLLDAVVTDVAAATAVAAAITADRPLEPWPSGDDAIAVQRAAVAMVESLYPSRSSLQEE